APAFDESASPTLSTPRILRARSTLEARALAAGGSSVPAASRLFRVTDRVDVEFESYGPGAAVPEVSAQLLNQKGERLIDLTVTRQASGAMRVTLPLTSLAPSTYIVLIEA